jgi:hypothetical protein
LISYLLAKYELYLDSNCSHLNDKTAKFQIKRV